MSEFADEILTAPTSTIIKLLSEATDEQLSEVLDKNDSEIYRILFAALNQKLANRIFSLASLDVLRRAFERVDDESLGQALSFAQPIFLSKLLSEASNDLVNRLVFAAKSANVRSQVIKALPPQRQGTWKKIVRDKEFELEQLRRDAEEGQHSLLDERKRLLDQINAAIRAREDVLRSVDEEAQIQKQHQERLFAEGRTRLQSLEEQIHVRRSEIEQREDELRTRLAQFEEENRRQVQQKIEAKVPEYVTAALKALEEKETRYRKKAAQWTVHGTFVLLAAIGATVALSLFGYGAASSIQDMSWQALFFVSFKGLIVLGVLGLWAKHAFTLSNAYMHEAIKRSDRAHAITFGKLYLEIYGNSVDKKELLDIFENWNITSESAFSKANPSGFEPQILERMGDILKLSEKTKSIS